MNLRDNADTADTKWSSSDFLLVLLGTSAVLGFYLCLCALCNRRRSSRKTAAAQTPQTPPYQPPTFEEFSESQERVQEPSIPKPLASKESQQYFYDILGVVTEAKDMTEALVPENASNSQPSHTLGAKSPYSSVSTFYQRPAPYGEDTSKLLSQLPR